MQNLGGCCPSEADIRQRIEHVCFVPQTDIDVFPTLDTKHWRSADPRQSMGCIMSGTKWMIEGREFAHCNCDYGCPCQFNALPTHGNCKAVVGLVIDRGYHGDTELDGLKAAAAFFFPGALHEGHGEGVVAIDERATPAQREALLRILSGQDTAPGATFFQILSTVTEKLHEPLFTTIDFEVDVDGRHARLNVPGMIEARGEPILNPVTGSPTRARIDLPNGFEYSIAEVGRGWAKSTGAVPFTLDDSHAHFAKLHMTQDGVVH